MKLAIRHLLDILFLLQEQFYELQIQNYIYIYIIVMYIYTIHIHYTHI